MKRTAILMVIFLVLAPLTARPAENTASLAGTWRFRIDERKTGLTEKWFAGGLAGGQQIKLPGTMDDAGLGPKNTKPPTLEGPYRLYDYAGPAWYQREIEIPAAWKGQRVTLFLERCRWVTSVWLDDKFIGTRDSLIAPHVYDFGIAVAPGKHRLTICVDNTVKLDMGKFVSALFGGTWGNMNGIIGRIELAATPPVWIDDVQVYPNLSTKSVSVKGRLGNATGVAGSGSLRLHLMFHYDARPTPIHEIPVSWDAAGGAFSAELPLADARPDLQHWDESSGNMYEVDALLNNGADRRNVSFGFREFAARGTQFTLNGRPIFLRGTLECSVFPLTGYPPTDVESWRRTFRILQSYGLNFMRFHSWCPPEAAFAAADEAGVMLQVEGPQANVQAGSNPQRDAFIEAEFKRIVDTYGNHPSFCLMTLGNEYGGRADLLARWVDMLIRHDPRHLYSSASSAQTTANRQFTENGAGRGIQGAGTERDLRAIVAANPRPVIGHEIGQWMYYPDFNEIKKYSGVMAVKNFEMIRDDLAKKDQLDLAPRYVQASGRFATLLYKEEIEVLLRTPGYSGFSLLDLHDYPTQGTALVGPLDPFWDSKGFITPEAWRRFCGPTVPLLRLPKRTYTTAETFTATADLAHYGPADLDQALPVWKITDAQGRVIAAGSLSPRNPLKVPTGKLTALGTISASLAKAPAPCKLKVTLSLMANDVSNDWDIWVYPASPAPQPPADVTVCTNWDQAKTALAAGKKVLYFAFAASTAESMRGRFLPVFWSPVWFPSQKPNTMGILCDPQQPLLAQFPTEFHSDWQWYNLMQNSRLFILDETPAAYRPLVQVIDNFARNHKLGLIFEGRAGGGRLLACGLDLPAMTGDPAARQMLESIYAYAGSAAFAPRQELGAGLLEKLFVPQAASQLSALGAKVRADSAAEDYAPENALDGQAETMWHTPWDQGAPNFPHSLIVELPRPARLAGLTCLPRQDGNSNGMIRQYAVYASADGKDWGTPVVQGAFRRGAALQTVKFAQPVTTRFLKFVAVSSFNANQPYASLAELDVVPAR